MQFFLKGIPEGRIFNVWCSGSNYTSWQPCSVEYAEATSKSALSWVKNYFAADMGGTELFSAMNAIVAARDKTLMTDVIVLTDGEAWCLDHARRSPADVSALDPFGRGRIYFLFHTVDESEIIARVEVQITANHDVRTLVIPVTVLGKQEAALHKQAARAMLDDLQRGRSHIRLGPNRPFPNSWEETNMVRKEAEEIACKWSLVSKWASFFLAEESYSPTGKDEFMDGVTEVKVNPAEDLFQPRGATRQTVLRGSIDTPNTEHATVSLAGYGGHRYNLNLQQTCVASSSPIEPIDLEELETPDPAPAGCGSDSQTKEDEADFIKKILQFQQHDGSIDFGSWDAAIELLGKGITDVLFSIKRCDVVDPTGVSPKLRRDCVWTVVVHVLLERDFQSRKVLWDLMAMRMENYYQKHARSAPDLLRMVKGGLERLKLPAHYKFAPMGGSAGVVVDVGVEDTELPQVVVGSGLKHPRDLELPPSPVTVAEMDEPASEMDEPALKRQTRSSTSVRNTLRSGQRLWSTLAWINYRVGCRRLWGGTHSFWIEADGARPLG